MSGFILRCSGYAYSSQSRCESRQLWVWRWVWCGCGCDHDKDPEQEPETPEPEPEEPQEMTECPNGTIPGWVVEKAYCVYHSEDSLDWETAKANCAALGTNVIQYYPFTGNLISGIQYSILEDVTINHWTGIYEHDGAWVFPEGASDVDVNVYPEVVEGGCVFQQPSGGTSENYSEVNVAQCDEEKGYICMFSLT